MSKRSGKREAGWVVFLVVSGTILWAMHQHNQGTDMAAWVPLFTLAWPISMTAAVGPHVVEHLRPKI